jgi:hypothetical protein
LPGKKPKPRDKKHSEGDNRDDDIDPRRRSEVGDIFRTGRRSSFLHGLGHTGEPPDPGDVFVDRKPRDPMSGNIEDILRDMDRDARAYRPDTYSLVREPTEKDLRLWDPPSVASVISFFERLEVVSQYSRQPIKIAVHMSQATRDVLTYYVNKHRTDIFIHEYNSLSEFGTILSLGRQYWTNAQCYAVLRWYVRPTTKKLMEDVLCRSVWPYTTWVYFKEESNINKDFKKYLFNCVQYLKNFNRQLDMLQISKEFLPTYVMKKSGVEGLTDYFLNGFPNRGYAWAIFKQGIPDRKRSDPAVTWQEISMQYIEVLEETQLHKEKAEDIASRFSKAGSQKCDRTYLSKCYTVGYYSKDVGSAGI